MKTFVIGAGPAGMAAAYEISKETPEVAVFEAGGNVGGMARSMPLWGQTVDLGPHRFFSKDRRVNELWLEVVGRDFSMVQRKTRILYRGKLFRYPLEPFGALRKLGLVEAARCAVSYASSRKSSSLQPPASSRNCESLLTSAPTFEDWVCQRFGRRLFEVFFKTYSEKLWGISCSDLDADFATQRIKQFSLAAAVKSALFPGERKRHRTLADEFAYPLGGTGMVYERMSAAVRARGGEVHLNSPVRRVLLQGNRAAGIELVSGEQLMCDQVISTMPLTVMTEQLDDVPPDVLNACRSLQFRNTILVYLEVLNVNPCPDQWIYVHSPELRLGRVTNFRNWVPQLYGDSLHTILALEYWCDPGDAFWQQDDEALRALGREEIVKSGLVSDPTKLGRSFVQRIPRCYPVYRRGYQVPLRAISDYLKTIKGLQVVGRYGAFKYNNQDHSILMGRQAAENVLQGRSHDLWGVNADYETYQEACCITETGLVIAQAGLNDTIRE